MNNKEFIDSINEKFNDFKPIRDEIITLVNDYVNQDNNEFKSSESAESVIDNFSLFGAWISDRLNGYSGVPACKGYQKSLTRKIRKALGFIF